MVRTHPLAIALWFFLIVCGPAARGQEQPPQTTEGPAETIRINTELVQTDVMVFDRQGRFVDGLQPEQFELRVDDQPVPVAFFERIVAGSTTEEAQRAAAGRAGPEPSLKTPDNKTQSRGRTVIFFIDDLHLSLDSLGRTRTAITHFIDYEMGARDQVAITSASGQIGFLQQLTDNKAVLRAALARLKHLAYRVQDTEQPTMSEYMALKIEQRDRDALGYYIARCLHDNPRYTPGKCAEVVQDRARGMIEQASAVTANTLSALESLMRSGAKMPGRKVVMLISDGFYLGALHRYGNAFDKLPQITDEARRHGIVIYTIDARGLISGQADATANLVDGNGLLDRANLGEIPASQDALHALAGDTGGRALRNSNSIKDWVTDTLKETSKYYLLAWRPLTAEQRAAGFKRISVKIIGHPELTARLPRGYLDSVNRHASAEQKTSRPAPKPAAAEKAQPPALADLQTALGDSFSHQALPTLLNITFLDTPNNGPLLTVSSQIATGALGYGNDARETATIDLAGVVLNTDGKPAASFRTQLNVAPLPANQTGAGNDGVIYNYRAPLAPGLYQVRVAARDARSGRVGSSMQWVEIPDLKTQGLSLSSLLTGWREAGGTQKVSADASALEPQMRFSVDQRFKRAARLEFLVFVYNASHNAKAFDLTGQVQLFDQRGQQVIETQARPLRVDETTDLARIPYAGSIALQALNPGQYQLRLTVTDRTTKTSATRQLDFTVE